jgi:hypothetical protein
MSSWLGIGVGKTVVVKGGEDTGIDAHKDESAARPYFSS